MLPKSEISQPIAIFDPKTQGPIHTYNQAGTFAVTLRVMDNDSASASSSTTATIGERMPADFSLSCQQDSISISAGESRQTVCTVTSLTSLNGFAAGVDLSCDVPTNPGVTCSFIPSQVTPPANGTVDSTLIIKATFETLLGTSDLRITGISEGRTFTAALRLDVQAV
jgi:PKD repeat protein